MRIQHNIMAMNAYRNYNTNTSALAKNLEKLSSGYKINRAGDDAAGLAISEKMRAQITGLNAAQKNVKDGISLVKTAEGAMQEIQDMLNRMDYLATQSANGTYDNEVDRKNLQKEVDQLRSEINRIADSANFNGIKLLDGSQSATGSKGVGMNMGLKLDDAACGLGGLHEIAAKSASPSFTVNVKEALHKMVAASTIAAGGSFTVSVNVGGQDINLKVTTTASIAKGSCIDLTKVSFALTNAALGTTGAEFTGANGTDKANLKVTLDTTTGKLSFATTTADKMVNFGAALDVKIKGDTKMGLAGGIDSWNCNTQEVVNGVAVNNDKLAHGEFELTADMVTALANGGTLKLDNVSITFDKTTDALNGTTIGVKDLMEGDNIKTDDATIKELVARISKAAAGCNAFNVGAGHGDNMISLQEKSGYYTSTSPDANLLDTREKFEAKIGLTAAGSGANAAGGLSLQIGDTSESYNQLVVSIGDMHTTSMGTAGGATIADIDISNQTGAKNAIQTIRDAINYVSSVRGDLGATQNRLEHTANNLSVMAENIQDAESTIRDTDVAEEMMKYTKNNILVQSAQAMLAQANAVPQGVLQLLG